VTFQTCVGVLLAAVLVAGAPAATGQPPLSDDGAGMTCRNYVVGARLEWLRPGGDWVDASGKEYGDQPFATQSIAGAADGQAIAWDVTSLATLWATGSVPPGALLLRIGPGSRSWSADFHSRESRDADKRPVLAVEWSDGTKQALEPTADTFLTCESYESKGTQTVLRVGPARVIAMVFPFAAASGRQVRHATLSLVAMKPKGRVDIGVFALTPPFTKESTRRAGLAARYPRDRGIERDPAVVFATRFEAQAWEREWTSIGKGNDAEAVQEDGNGFAPLDGHALKVMIRTNHTIGLNMHRRFAQPGNGGKAGSGEPEELYFRYYLRLGEDWNPYKDGGKLPGLAGTYGRAGWGNRKTDGTNGWSARGGFVRQRPRGSSVGELSAIGSYVYHADTKSTHGEYWGWNLGPSGLVERNRWYSVEQYVKLNAPDANDGILRAWIDGYMVFERTDIRFRSDPGLRIESLWMNVYHGGTVPAPQDMTLYIDNIVVAREYIGPLAP
jgi:hypothetical protein